MITPNAKERYKLHLQLRKLGIIYKARKKIIMPTHEQLDTEIMELHKKHNYTVQYIIS